MYIQLRRTQHPVGQGGFHSCTIHSWEKDDTGLPHSYFEYVYDCGTYSLAPNGASRSQHIKTHIDRYRPIDEKVDLLFLSHLDADHYNGAEQLCKNKTVARIVLPYFTAEEICFVIAQQSLKKDTPLSVMYIKNLLSLAHGGTTLFGVPVTKVMPARGNPDLPNSDRPDDPTPLRPIGPGSDASQRAVACTLDPHGRPRPLGSGVANGTSIVLVAPSAGSGTAQLLPVILRPWSYMQSPAAVDFMRMTIACCKPLAKLFGNSCNVTPADIAALEKAKSTLRKACRDIIKAAGGTYAGSERHPNVNTPSLCLYSGLNPAKKPPFASIDILSATPFGWIGTGDALLKRHWTEFEACFRDVLPITRTYVVPHHGSLDNHRSEFIQSFPPRATAVISAGFGQTRHPSRSVVCEIHETGHRLEHVTEFNHYGSTQHSWIRWKCL